MGRIMSNIEQTAKINKFQQLDHLLYKQYIRTIVSE